MSEPSVVQRLVARMRDATTSNPRNVELADVIELYGLLHQGAAVLELMEQQHEQLFGMLTAGPRYLFDPATGPVVGT